MRDANRLRPTGSSLINFDFNYQLAIIQTIVYRSRGRTKIPSLEPHLKNAFKRIKAISERIKAVITQKEGTQNAPPRPSR
jgi:hypothetical protein